MREPILVALALLAASAPSPSWAGPRSIVGDWAASRSDCGTQFTYRIGARSLVTDALSCGFAGVSRRADEVRFVGSCDAGPGDSPETVLARLRGQRLSLRFLRGGGTVDGLSRCAPRR